MPVVKIFPFLELKQKYLFSKGLKIKIIFPKDYIVLRKKISNLYF